MGEFIEQNPVLFICILVWDLIWRLLALWRAAKNRQILWFVLLAILSTVGILPIIYLLTHRKVKK